MLILIKVGVAVLISDKANLRARKIIRSKEALLSCQVMCDSRDPLDYSMPGFPFLHYLPEFTQTHVH